MSFLNPSTDSHNQIYIIENSTVGGPACTNEFSLLPLRIFVFGGSTPLGKGRELVIPKECVLYWVFFQTSDVGITIFFFSAGVCGWETQKGEDKQ